MVVGVVGAGITGLTAAFELLQRGVEVKLFEPSAVGGLIESKVCDGFTTENGPNVLLERPDLARMVDALNVRDKVLYPAIERYEQYVWCKGRTHLVPKSFLPFIRSELFSLGTKCSIPFALFKKGLLQPKNEDLSVLDFFTPLLGKSTTEALLDPVLKGIYGGDVRALSARSIFPQLWHVANSGGSLVNYMRSRKGGGTPKVVTFRGGIQTLTNTLWETLRHRVDFRAERVVTVVRQDSGRFLLSTSSGGSVEVDQVVLTPAGKTLAALLRSVSEDAARMLDGMQYATLAMTHVSVPGTAKVPPRAFGVLFPGGMKHHLLGVMYKSVVFPDMAPKGEHLLSVVLGGAQAGTYAPTEDELRQNVAEVLGGYFGFYDLKWLGSRVWSSAIPQLTVGHFKVVYELDKVEAQVPGLIVAGIDRGGVGVSDRIKMGVEAVSRVMSRE